jgi:hypothetical protein
MDQHDWDTFFSLVDRVVNMGGTWQEKKAEVERRNNEHGSASFGEMVSWFGGEVDDD